MTVAIHPDVLADWGAWSARLEGRVSWPYLDERGLVTVGIGCLIDPFPLARGLLWMRAGVVAKPDQIETEWNRVKAMKAGEVASFYRDALSLHLSDAAIDALAAHRLQANADVLVRYFPDLATYPAPVQRALFSIAWACGAGFPPSWPHITACVLRRDWKGAAANATGATLARERNAAQVALFLEAAAMEDEGPAPKSEPHAPAGCDVRDPAPTPPPTSATDGLASPQDAPAAPAAQWDDVTPANHGGEEGA
ncbi:MAG TPA: hypothetical protein VLT47_11005 [Anaeromyxobacteraceae bacterium]|nr:hypothetical protein [Anaeromyxobacteraceae bacterium]